MSHFLAWGEGVEKIMLALAERYLYPFYLSRDYKNFSPSNWHDYDGSSKKIAHLSPLYKESVAFAHVKRIKNWNYGVPTEVDPIVWTKFRPSLDSVAG